MSLMGWYCSCSYFSQVPPSTGRKRTVQECGPPTSLCLGGIPFLETPVKMSFYVPWPTITVRKAGWVNGKSLACLGSNLGEHLLCAGSCAAGKKVNKTGMVSAYGSCSESHETSKAWAPGPTQISWIGISGERTHHLHLTPLIPQVTLVDALGWVPLVFSELSSHLGWGPSTLYIFFQKVFWSQKPSTYLFINWECIINSKYIINSSCSVIMHILGTCKIESFMDIL